MKLGTLVGRVMNPLQCLYPDLYNMEILYFSRPMGLCQCDEGSWDKDIVLDYQSGHNVVASFFIRRRQDGKICQKKKMWQWNQRLDRCFWKIAEGVQKLGMEVTSRSWKRQGSQFYLRNMRGMQPWWRLNFSLLTCRNGREHICVVLNY